MCLSQLTGEQSLKGPPGSDSIGVDVGTLPAGVGVLDLDNPLLTRGVLQALTEENAALSVERTPSGGLHIWGVLKASVPKEVLSASGIPLEYFSTGRITILGRGREILTWVPLGALEGFPLYIRPISSKSIPEIEAPVPSGRRWNALYKQIRENRYLDKGVLLFQARALCLPPLEETKVEELVTILDRTLEGRKTLLEEGGEDCLESSVCDKLVEHLRGRWIYRIPDRQWYRYEEGCWKNTDCSSFELMTDIDMEIKRAAGSYTKGFRRRMGTLQFRKLIEENMRQLLYCTPTPLEGLHFHNGLLVEREGSYTLLPP